MSVFILVFVLFRALPSHPSLIMRSSVAVLPKLKLNEYIARWIVKQFINMKLVN